MRQRLAHGRRSAGSGMRTRILTALLVIGLVGAWGPAAEAQVNALTGRVTADVPNSTNTFANVTGLTWYVAASTNYAFVCELSYTAGSTGTALQLSVNGPAIGAGAVRFSVTTATSATAVHFASQSAYEANTNPGSSGGSTALPATIAGVIENGATAGTVAIRFRSESTTIVTVLRGSSCTVYR